MAGAADELPGADRGDEQAAHQRQDLQAGAGGAGAKYDLEEQRQVGDRAEQRKPHHEPDGAGDGEHGVTKQPGREHRLGGAPLRQHEGHDQDHREDAEADDLRRPPAVVVPAQGAGQDERGECARQEPGAHVIDRMVGLVLARGQRRRQHGERGDADRQVDVEDPAPAQGGGEETAEQRSDHAGQSEHGAEQPLVAAAVARGHDVADRCHGADQEPPAAESLERAERNQLGQGLSDAAQRRADEEDDQRDLQHDLAAVEVAELAVHRGDRGLGQQVGGHHPRDVAEAAEVADDGRQRGGHDGLVQRRHQQHQHQSGEYDGDAARGVGVRRGGAVGAHADSPDIATSQVRSAVDHTTARAGAARLRAAASVTIQPTSASRAVTAPRTQMPLHPSAPYSAELTADSAAPPRK